MNVYLNGWFVDQQAASVSVLDRGFLFGDGVYEVIPVYRRQPFYLDAHLNRLQKSFDGICLANPHTKAEWTALVYQIIDTLDHDDQSLYLHISRGAAPKRDHAFPEKITPTILGMTNPLPAISKDVLENGLKTITLTDTRWSNCHYKTTALLPNTLLRQQAVAQGAAEAILLRDGLLTEGAASNILMVKSGTIFSPVRDHRILHGITLEVIEYLAKQQGIPMVFCDITEAQLRNADEVWLTSSTKEVLPVTTIDGKPVTNGKPGPLFEHMFAFYQTHKQEQK